MHSSVYIQEHEHTVCVVSPEWFFYWRLENVINVLRDSKTDVVVQIVDRNAHHISVNKKEPLQFTKARCCVAIPHLPLVDVP